MIMTHEEIFKKGENKLIEDYLKLENPKTYDFRNDFKKPNSHNFLNQYINMDTLEKQIYYGAILKCGSIPKGEFKKRVSLLIDPDSNSLLLQKIYKSLWFEYLEPCRANRTIKGDTINSFYTTFNRISDSDARRMDIIYHYIETKENGYKIYAKKYKHLEKFLSISHTLGNFIPCPYTPKYSCNQKRANSVGDYWDLTLFCIYKYYQGNKKYLATLMGYPENNTYKKYKDWLDLFKNDKGIISWNVFVEKNYMESFVNKENEGNWGKPKELWKGHFKAFQIFKDNNVKINENKWPNKSQANEFFKNATKFIEIRSVNMLKVLNKKYTKVSALGD